MITTDSTIFLTDRASGIGFRWAPTLLGASPSPCDVLVEWLGTFHFGEPNGCSDTIVDSIDGIRAVETAT